MSDGDRPSLVHVQGKLVSRRAFKHDLPNQKAASLTIDQELTKMAEASRGGRR